MNHTNKTMNKIYFVGNINTNFGALLLGRGLRYKKFGEQFEQRKNKKLLIPRKAY